MVWLFKPYHGLVSFQNSHAREVSFPGGKCDSKDETEVEAAVRETQEELGIEPEVIQVWTKMAAISNHTGKSF